MVTKNIQEVSGYFFFSIGIIYFLLALFVYNKVYLPKSYILFNIIDIPFAFVSLLYVSTSICLYLDKSIYKNYKILIFITACLLLGIIIYINIVLPDII